MPWMQAFVERLNTRFNSTNIKWVDESLLEPGRRLVDAAAASIQGDAPIAARQEEVGYISGHYSDTQLDRLRALLYEAVTPDSNEPQDRVPVQFLWAPSDDGKYYVEYWKVPGTQASGSMPPSRGGISVLLRGPSPTDVEEYYKSPPYEPPPG